MPWLRFRLGFTSCGWKLTSRIKMQTKDVWNVTKLRVRPEQWPRVRLPAPEPMLEIVETARSAVHRAAPFACGPHQHVVEHETYAACLDCPPPATPTPPSS
eukprot:705897-Amphidinium_carterae.1